MVLGNSAASSLKVVQPIAEAYANMCKAVCGKGWEGGRVTGCGIDEDSYILLILAFFASHLSMLCEKERGTHLCLSTMPEFVE